jgi:hypothetical protein
MDGGDAGYGFCGSGEGYPDGRWVWKRGQLVMVAHQGDEQLERSAQ